MLEACQSNGGLNLLEELVVGWDVDKMSTFGTCHPLQV